MRMLEGSWGWTEAHARFVEICKKKYLPSEALPIIEYPSFPKNMKRTPMVGFYIDCCDVLIMLQKYQKAYEVIMRAQKIPVHDEDKLLAMLPRVVVLSLYMGKEMPYEFKETVKAHLSALFKDDERRRYFKMDLGKIQKMVDFFLQLNAWRELKEGEIKMLKEEDLLDVYRASKYRSLGKYIEAEIKGQNWRVKSTDVKNTPVGDFNVVKSINSP